MSGKDVSTAGFRITNCSGSLSVGSGITLMAACENKGAGVGDGRSQLLEAELMAEMSGRFRVQTRADLWVWT
jgi:hypothetical protein